MLGVVGCQERENERLGRGHLNGRPRELPFVVDNEHNQAPTTSNIWLGNYPRDHGHGLKVCAPK